jgi:hypothetical protein
MLAPMYDRRSLVSDARPDSIGAFDLLRPDSAQPDSPVLRIVQESRKVRADFLRELRRVTRAFGISEAEIRAIEGHVTRSSSRTKAYPILAFRN